MTIDWSNEPYARLYKRETDDDLLLSWEARAVWHEFLKKCDKSGVLETKRGMKGVAALLRVPLDVVERVLQELIEDGRMRSVPDIGFVAPNYTEANYTPRSTGARKAESRLRQKHESVSVGNDQHGAGEPSRDVTNGHEPSRDVTQDNTSQVKTSHQSAPSAPMTPPLKKPRKKMGAQIPPDWQPRDQERELARQYGLDCDHEAQEFITFWLGDGRVKADWDQTFRNRLHTQSKRRPNWQRQADMPGTREPRRIKEL